MGIFENKEILKYFKDSVIFVFFILASTIVLGILFEQISKIIISLIINYTAIDSVYSSNVFVDIVIHNIIATLLLLAAGFTFSKKSFRLFGKIYLAFTGSMGGFAIAYVTNKTNLIYALMLIIPHGIIELTTICFVISVGTIVGREEIKNIDKKDILQIIAIIIIGIISAAFVEAYITKIIASMFL